jgi:hypothetical protein
MDRFSFFPNGDSEQVLRFRRYLIAAATSVLLVALLMVYYLEGLLRSARPHHQPLGRDC